MVDLARRISPPRRNNDFNNKIMAYCDGFFRWMRNLSYRPVPMQIGVGASGGWVIGYFFTKTSKIFALLLGCSFIVIQFFNYRGYIRFHRSQIEQDVHALTSRVKKELGYRQGFPSAKEADDFLTRYAYLFSGFIAGNLIGYGMA